MTKQRLWECPSGEHAAVRGPGKPRRDNICRYCLPCSERAGRLVERVCPANDRLRAEKRERSVSRAREKARTRRDVERRKRYVRVRETDGTFGEVDVERTIRKMLKLPVLAPYAKKRGITGVPVTVRYGIAKWYSTGHAYPGGDITITVHPTVDRVEVEEVLLHELVHVLLPSKTHHGSRYRSALVIAARQWWPGIAVRADDAGEQYEIDRLIRDAARESLGVVGL